MFNCILKDVLWEDCVYGLVDADLLNNIELKIEAFKVGNVKRPMDIMRNAKTCVIVGCPVDTAEEVYNRNILLPAYPGYGAVLDKIRRLKIELQNCGYNIRIANDMSLKNLAVFGGLGVWGKSSLVLNPEYGTRLRFGALVTDYIPTEYSKQLIGVDLCGDCDVCIKACGYACISDYVVNAKRCYCKYIDKKKLSMTLPMCSVCQSCCPVGNEREGECSKNENE